jgi:hypothetical protein
VKSVPAITTEVPPAVGPVVGLSDVIAGATTAVLSTTAAITWRLGPECNIDGVSELPLAALYDVPIVVVDPAV